MPDVRLLCIPISAWQQLKRPVFLLLELTYDRKTVQISHQLSNLVSQFSGSKQFPLSRLCVCKENSDYLKWSNLRRTFTSVHIGRSSSSSGSTVPVITGFAMISITERGDQRPPVPDASWERRVEVVASGRAEEWHPSSSSSSPSSSSSSTIGETSSTWSCNNASNWHSEFLHLFKVLARLVELNSPPCTVVHRLVCVPDKERVDNRLQPVNKKSRPQLTQVARVTNLGHRNCWVEEN